MSKITDKIIEQRMITEIKSSIMDRILEDIIKDSTFDELKPFEILAVRKIVFKKHKWFCRVKA